MNFTELLHSFFDEPATTALGRVAGLDSAAARRALETGLPLQLDALAAQAMVMARTRTRCPPRRSTACPASRACRAP